MTIIGVFVMVAIILFTILCFGSGEKNKGINDLDYVVPEEIGWSSAKLEEAKNYAQ